MMLLRPGRKAWLSALEMDFPASSLNDLHSSYAKGDRLAVTVVKGDEEDAEGGASSAETQEPFLPKYLKGLGYTKKGANDGPSDAGREAPATHRTSLETQSDLQSPGWNKESVDVSGEAWLAPDGEKEEKRVATYIVPQVAGLTNSKPCTFRPRVLAVGPRAARAGLVKSKSF